MKRIILLFFTMFCSFVVLAGCANEKGNENDRRDADSVFSIEIFLNCDPESFNGPEFGIKSDMVYDLEYMLGPDYEDNYCSFYKWDVVNQVNIGNPISMDAFREVYDMVVNSNGTPYQWKNEDPDSDTRVNMFIIVRYRLSDTDLVISDPENAEQLIEKLNKLVESTK